MEEQLFAAVDLPRAQIGFLRGDTADAAAECARYDRAIEAAGGIDLLVCGLGANGHIGFNEPGPVLWGATHWPRCMRRRGLPTPRPSAATSAPCRRAR